MENVVKQDMNYDKSPQPLTLICGGKSCLSRFPCLSRFLDKGFTVEDTKDGVQIKIKEMARRIVS